MNQIASSSAQASFGRRDVQHQAAAAYHTQQIMTAPPVRLVAMLYERAIRSLRDAVRAIETKDVQTRFKNVERASEIIVHRSEEHTSELQSLMRISYAVFCLKKKKNTHTQPYR